MPPDFCASAGVTLNATMAPTASAMRCKTARIVRTSFPVRPAVLGTSGTASATTVRLGNQSRGVRPRWNLAYGLFPVAFERRLDLGRIDLDRHTSALLLK